MKRSICLLVLLSLLLTGCSENVAHESVYQLRLTPTAEERDDAQVESQNAQKAVVFFEDAEANLGVFACDAWNYGIIEGKPRYEHARFPDAPVEVDSWGKCIRVSKGYLALHPIKTVDGGDVLDALVLDDRAINVLVPIQYKDMEELIVNAYVERLYFDTVEVENIYRERNREEPDSTPIDAFSTNVIYINDGLSHETYNPEVGIVTDPVIMVYTHNIHPIQAYAMFSRGVYITGHGKTADENYAALGQYVDKHDVSDLFKDARQITK